jgi:hypothetical protein
VKLCGRRGYSPTTDSIQQKIRDHFYKANRQDAGPTS